MVALLLFSQNPPVAGMAYPVVPNTGFKNGFEPAIRNVPLLMERKPTVVSPRTKKEPVPGVNINVEVFEVPLFKVTPVIDFRLVKPLPLHVFDAAPVKVMSTCEAFAFSLKLMVPLLVRFPPIESVLVWITPTAFASKVAPAEIVTLPPTVKDRAVKPSYFKKPETPWPTVMLRATAAVLICTTVPSAIITSSAAVGTNPHDQVAGLFQSKPDARETQVSRGTWGRAIGAGSQSSASKE